MIRRALGLIIVLALGWYVFKRWGGNDDIAGAIHSLESLAAFLFDHAKELDLSPENIKAKTENVKNTINEVGQTAQEIQTNLSDVGTQAKELQESVEKLQGSLESVSK